MRELADHASEGRRRRRVWRAQRGPQRFAENDVSFSILPDLTDQHLKEIGVSLGHRLQLLQAIAELTSREKEAPKPAATTATSAAPQDGAERRQVTVMFADLVGSTALSARMDQEFGWSGDEAETQRLKEEHAHHYLRWTFFGAACVCLTPDGTNSKNSVTPPTNSEGNRDLELQR
jgi:class 3 adenylate cyclase